MNDSIDDAKAAQVRVYRPWVGVIITAVLPGATQYLRGDRAGGLRWILGLAALNVIAVLLLPFPDAWALAAALTLGLAAFVLWGYLMVKSRRPVPAMTLKGWAMLLAAALVLNAGIDISVMRVIETYSVPAASMSPTLAPGDQIVVERVTRRARTPQRGDIVVFRSDGIPALNPEKTVYIKRVAGLPGETVQIRPPDLVINGRPVTEPVHFARRRAGLAFLESLALPVSSSNRVALASAESELTLGPDEYFVIGDNDNSFDSRYWGPVPAENILGRVTRIYWPLSRASVRLIP